MAAMSNMQLDETSCGPLCQHPQCWASNRRVERGLPRIDVFPDKHSHLEDGSLPTLKIQNMLDEYGLSSADHYPSNHHVAISSLGVNRLNRQRRRSASVPSSTPDKCAFPQTPHQSAESGTRSGRGRSRSALLEPIKCLYPPKLSKVHLNQLCGPVNPSNEIYMMSQVYVWQPSNKAVQKRKEVTVKGNQGSEPKLISPKDLTETLLPSGISEQGQSTKKMKNKRSNQTPTGGRPYTHPSKSPAAMTRRTLPADMDEGIAQLLSLPRDVMLAILEHTKESDLFDKEKVQAFLAKVMPHIHFDTTLKPTTSDQAIGSPPPPLHAIGLLRNQKMSILEGKHKFEKTDMQNKVTRKPLLLDDTVMPASSFARQGCHDEGRFQQQTYDEDAQALMPAATTSSESLSHRKNRLGPMPDVGHLLPRKITAVSAKSLPPLQPGVRGTKPFNYNTQSLDLALSPLSTPEIPTPEELSTLRSGKASTLYVTLPSEPSEDRTVTSAKHPHLAVLRQGSPYTTSITSSHASDEFGLSLRAMSPSYSTHIPKPPHGTPATAPQAIFRENTQPSAKTSTTYDSRGVDDLVENTSRKSAGSSRVRVSSAEKGLRTIHEYVVDSDASTPDTVVAHPASVRTPSVKPPRSVSPWETAGNKLSNGRTTPPVIHSATPTPSNPSPDIWPVVDERSYLHSPEAVVHSKKIDIPETVAPPPSPEPRVISTEPTVKADSKVASLSDGEELKCTGISLTHLSDDNKICTEGIMIQRVMEVNQLEEQIATPDSGIAATSNNGPIESPADAQKPAAPGLPAIQEDDDTSTHSLNMGEDDKIEEGNGVVDFKNIDNALNKLEIEDK